MFTSSLCLDKADIPVRRGFKALCTPNESVSRLDFLSGVTRTPATAHAARRETQAARAEVDDALEALSLEPKA
jgi:hypothetical protein